MNVYRDATKLSSSIHRKDTFSGVYTNFKSYLPDSYKRGLVSTLLYRAYMISSTFQSLHEEVEKLKKIFSRNGYRETFIDKCIFKFLNKLYDKRDPLTTVPKKEITIMLPFLGTTSWQIKNGLTRSLQNAAPFCKLKIIFKTSKRLSSIFSFKDKLPKSLMSGVIYKYTCGKCNLTYVGSTKRYWEKRLEEHVHISALTGKPLHGLQVFAPMAHVRSNCCPETKICRDDFSIIGREKDNYLVQVKESIIISTTRPGLNNNIVSIPLSLFAP